jgi:hypothetical protein
VLFILSALTIPHKTPFKSFYVAISEKWRGLFPGTHIKPFMSRKRPKFPPGTWIERTLFESKAFLSLKGFAPQLLILFLAKRQFDRVGKKGKEQRVCMNQDSLTFTYVEAKKKYGLSVPKFSRAIDELLAKGFIEVKYQGGHCQRDKSIYALSDLWQLWRPGEVLNRRVKDTVQRGFRKPNRKKLIPIRSQ